MKTFLLSLCILLSGGIPISGSCSCLDRQVLEHFRLDELEKSTHGERLVNVTTAGLQTSNHVFILIITVLSVVVISILLYRNFLFKRKGKFGKEMLLQQALQSKAVIEAEEEERTRIVNELHEDIGQRLSAAKLNISALQSFLQTPSDTDKIMLQNAVDLLDDSVKKVRSVSGSMIPNSLIRSGIESALTELVDKINVSGKNKIYFEVIGNVARQEQIKEIILFRIIKEVVNNAIKHSGVPEVVLQVIMHDHELNVLVVDKGKGFDVKKVTEWSTTNGLRNIASRVAVLNGNIFYDSHPGKGTTVNIEIPM